MNVTSIDGIDLKPIKDDKSCMYAVDLCIDSLVIAYDKPRFSENVSRILSARFPRFYEAAKRHGLSEEDAQKVFGILVYTCI